MATRTIYTTPYAIWKSRSGVVYTADADGVLANVDSASALDFVRAGASFTPLDAVGLTATFLQNTDATTPAGVGLVSTTAAGTFYIDSTLGTKLDILGEIATSNTKTDDMFFDYPIPASYIDGAAIPVVVNAQTKGAGTAGTETVQIKAYRIGPDGTSGAALNCGAAQTLTGAAASYSFAVPGATLNPGDRIQIVCETVIQETAGGNLQAQINSIKVG